MFPIFLGLEELKKVVEELGDEDQDGFLQRHASHANILGPFSRKSENLIHISDFADGPPNSTI